MSTDKIKALLQIGKHLGAAAISEGFAGERPAEDVLSDPNSVEQVNGRPAPSSSADDLPERPTKP